MWLENRRENINMSEPEHPSKFSVLSVSPVKRASVIPYFADVGHFLFPGLKTLGPVTDFQGLAKLVVALEFYCVAYCSGEVGHWPMLGILLFHRTCCL